MYVTQRLLILQPDDLSFQAYLARIEEVNKKGPALNAVTETNPKVLHYAEVMDRERKEGNTRGPLHGIPVLLKDNIGTVHGEGL